MADLIILDEEQGSDEWLAARMGILTGTGFSNLLTPGTLKRSASVMPYMGKLLAEYVSGEQQDKFSTADTERGTELEPTAVLMYEAITGKTVERVGMVYRDEKRDRACSPDGLIPFGGAPTPIAGYEKGLEIKCLQLKNHIMHVLKGVLPNDYKMQVHGSMYITNLDSWDFMSFHPEFRPLIITVERDWDIDRAIHKEAEMFCERLADEKAKIDAAKEF